MRGSRRELWIGIISKEHGKHRRAGVDSRHEKAHDKPALPKLCRGFDAERSTMKINTTALSVSILVMALLASLAILKSATAADDDTVAAITKLENDSVKADLASDKSYPEKVLAADWTGGDSSGKWFTKQAVLKMMGDPKNNKTNTEKIPNSRFARTAVPRSRRIRIRTMRWFKESTGPGR